MYQTSINKIEQDLKDLKRKFQCGTQFFASVEEFPEVGKECAVYVDKSTGAFYVYDPTTGTYISADTGDTPELSGAGVNEQVTYWTGPSTLGGDGELTYNSTTNLLSSGNLQLTNLQPATVDTDKFLVSDLGTLKTRTGTEILSDIGGIGGTGTGVAGQVAYFSGASSITGNNDLFWDAVNNRLGVGLNTGLTARAHVRGSGNTSATTALLVQNNDVSPARLMSVRDDGRIYIGSQSDTQAPFLAGYTGTSPHGASQRALGIVWNGGAGTRPNPGVLFTASSDTNWTSGSADMFQTLITFNPTSGTGVLNSFVIQNTINQTGGANGITRGLYVSPILTAAADWRSIEFSNNTGWGIYGAGTANNYLGGRLALNSTSLTNVTLRNSIAISGSTSSFGYFSDGIIQSGVTSTASYFHISPQTQNASFTLTNLNGYYVENPNIGASSAVTNVYGFYGNIASGTGRWNLYMNGTAANYLAGNTSIGTTTSSGRLTVQGSGTTSATKAFVVNNSTPTAILEILDNGRINQTIPGATNNTIFGTGAGASASLTGVSNSFFGINAGFSNTTGGNNSFFGLHAGYYNTTGVSNSFFGTYAGFRNTTGANNSFFGLQAGFNNTTGVSNSFFGLNAGFSNTTGGSNSFFGQSAGRYIADGVTALTVANNSVFLGFDTRADADSQTNQIVIGHQAIGNGSNTATLGNTSITATYLRGSVSIDAPTINASAKLQIDSTTKGFLPPRLTTTERNAIASPAAGLVIFNTTTTKLECYDGAVWQAAW